MTDATVAGTSTFPGQGTIRFRGVMKSLREREISVPIVDGTGKFGDAKGTLLIGPGQRSRSTRTADRARHRHRLTPSPAPSVRVRASRA